MVPWRTGKNPLFETIMTLIGITKPQLVYVLSKALIDITYRSILSEQSNGCLISNWTALKIPSIELQLFAQVFKTLLVEDKDPICRIFYVTNTAAVDDLVT